MTVLPFGNPWASAGLKRLEDIPEPKPRQTWQTGFAGLAGKVALAPGMVSVVTGMPGSGKTFLWAQIWNYVVEKYDLVALIASFECPVRPDYLRYLREFKLMRREKHASPEELQRIDQKVAEHYRFLEHPDETPSIEWLIEMAQIAVVRDGAKIVQIDPWNRLESQRGEGENETEYVLRCLRMFTVFAKAFDVHVQIVAHPAKRDPRRRDQPPEMEDVSGSQNWWNVPDQGFVVHRPKFWDAHGDRCYDAIFYQRKARFEDLGYPCAIGIRFDPIDRRFKERDLGRGEAE